MPSPSPDLDLSPRRLSHIRWIGGGSGAGKSTVAARLAADFGLRLYSCDDAQPAHTARSSDPAEYPQLAAFMAMSMDERWLLRGPAEMYRTFHGFHGEGFRHILADLLALPPGVPVLVEGYKLLPRLVFPLLSRPGQAVWLLPTPAWRRAAFARRGSLWTIAGRTGDPPAALANLLARDALFTAELARQAAALGLAVIPVDGSAPLADLVAQAAGCLGLPPA